jgi:hypothetical protein
MKYQVIIPNWEAYYVKAKKTNPKYWLWKDKDKLPQTHLKTLANKPSLRGNKLYCVDTNNNLYLKNTKSVGKENIWVLNGQALYNATIDYRMRRNVAEYYHNYFSKYIKQQLKPIILIKEKEFLSISCDIYEIKRKMMPDISNMWLLEKFFEDALQECKIIPDDSPDYVLESGRKKYHWVSSKEERKLIFNIEIIK